MLIVVLNVFQGTNIEPVLGSFADTSGAVAARLLLQRPHDVCLLQLVSVRLAGASDLGATTAAIAAACMCVWLGGRWSLQCAAGQASHAATHTAAV